MESYIFPDHTQSALVRVKTKLKTISLDFSIGRLQTGAAISTVTTQFFYFIFKVYSNELKYGV